MIFWFITLLFFVCNLNAQSSQKKLPSISYQNLIQCYPELKESKFEYGIDLPLLKKEIDQKYPSTKSTLRYRKVLFTDPKLGTERHRLTISLQKWVKNQPQYDYYLEVLDKENTGELVPTGEKFKNPIKEAPQRFLLGAMLIEDESLLVDTKPNKIEMSYKTSNDSVIELDLSKNNGNVQLKCESKKSQGVLCLCLKR